MIDSIHTLIEASVSGGFWRFAGYWLMLGMILVVPANVIIQVVAYMIKAHYIYRIGKLGDKEKILKHLGKTS